MMMQRQPNETKGNIQQQPMYNKQQRKTQKAKEGERREPVRQVQDICEVNRNEKRLEITNSK